MFALRINRLISGELTTAAQLPRDRRCGRISVSGRGWSSLDAVTAFAAIDITDQDLSFGINRNIKKIQEVAGDVRAAPAQKSAPLHGSIGSYIGRGPMLAAIESVRDIKVPGADKMRGVRIASAGRSIESDCGASTATGDRGRKGDLLQAKLGANIEDILPSLPEIIGGSDGRDRTT